MECMSVSGEGRINAGGYTSPFSGVGMEFFPLGLLPGPSGVVLHEVGYLADNQNWNFPGIFSPYWRLIYDWRPSHKLVFPGGEIPLGPEYLVLNPDHIRCDFRGDAPIPTSWFHFTHDRRPAHARSMPICLSPTPVERELLKTLTELLEPQQKEHRRRILNLGLALLQVVLSRPELRWLEEPPEGVSRVTQHIREHFAEPLYNPVLAQSFGMSVRSLARSFRNHHGVSPTRFIAQVRVREVANLLTASGCSLEEIAVSTGFPNAAYLSRIFKQLTGGSPSAFRRMHQIK